ncbi:hypothetical protein K438DRAFT_1772555 [Mycena galopus ATCC 62051]|nr:hypothetical protein K438DRAFT_1772555 [Mycena galopus ATCC 62051]
MGGLTACGPEPGYFSFKCLQRVNLRNMVAITLRSHWGEVDQRRLASKAVEKWHNISCGDRWVTANLQILNQPGVGQHPVHRISIAAGVIKGSETTEQVNGKNSEVVALHLVCGARLNSLISGVGGKELDIDEGDEAQMAQMRETNDHGVNVVSEAGIGDCEGGWTLKTWQEMHEDERWGCTCTEPKIHGWTQPDAQYNTRMQAAEDVWTVLDNGLEQRVGGSWAWDSAGQVASLFNKKLCDTVRDCRECRGQGEVGVQRQWWKRKEEIQNKVYIH